MTDYYLIRGMTTVGTFSTDPYEYEYRGQDPLVEVVLEEGPPTTRMTGAETANEPDVHADKIEELNPSQQLSEFEAALAAVGIEIQAPSGLG